MARPDLDSRLDAIGWGLLFLVTGGVLLIPDAPSGSWLMSVGAVLLVMTAVRAILGLHASWFIAVLGAVALVFGIGEATGNEIPGVALVLILCGAALIVSQLLRGRTTSES